MNLASLTLSRKRFCADGVFGELYSGDGSLLAVTLEHAFQQLDESFAPAVPAGIYRCERRLSPEFGYELYQVLNVPGHSFIEIHIGNFNHDSKGCVLLGMQATDKMIVESKKAFQRFMQIMSGINTSTLTVI